MAFLPTAYDEYLDRLLDTVYTRFDRTTWKPSGLRWSYADLAAAAGLSVSTVRRHAKHQTRLPRLRTVLGLAAAVGLTVTFTTANGRGRKGVA